MSTPLPNAWLADLAPYRVPRPSAPIDLRLDGNEGSTPDPELLRFLDDGGAELLRRYPDQTPLEHELAERLRVAPEQVLVTAGADDALERALAAYCEPGRRLVLPSPTFEMLERYARRTGCEVVRVPWPSGPWPLRAVCDACAAAPDVPTTIAVVSPNNPTGAVATVRDLEQLAAALPQALLLVDQAYAEYADSEPELDLTAAALRLDHAVVVRSLSKAWGLAGARVGYAVGPVPIVRSLRAAGHPFAVAGPSLRLAAARLRTGEAAMHAHVRRVAREREQLTALLAELGAAPRPSQANFVLAAFRDAALVQDALAGLGTGVRRFPGEPLLEGTLRITCPADAESFARLGAGLRTALSPQCLVLDLDGVVADVSQSYRAAMLETAREFGVELTAEDVAFAKRAALASSDEELTWRMVGARGVRVPLADVKTQFERLYQGTRTEPGFYRRERLLAERSLLERLARRLPLALVTGRPRRDTERFLADTGVAEPFATLVCREDAPAKPDPAPMRLALERLGVTRGWAVGDTVDDVRAARAAGLCSFGLPAAGEERERERAAAALIAAGAGRVLGSLGEIETMLP